MNRPLRKAIAFAIIAGLSVAASVGIALNQTALTNQIGNAFASLAPIQTARANPPSILAQASAGGATVNLDSNQLVTSIQNLTINGAKYSVAFEKGQFNNLYSREPQNPARAPFWGNEAAAREAAAAIAAVLNAQNPPKHIQGLYDGAESSTYLIPISTANGTNTSVRGTLRPGRGSGVYSYTVAVKLVEGISNTDTNAGYAVFYRQGCS